MAKIHIPISLKLAITILGMTISVNVIRRRNVPLMGSSRKPLPSVRRIAGNLLANVFTHVLVN
jgi:hypothetical protein